MGKGVIVVTVLVSLGIGVLIGGLCVYFLRPSSPSDDHGSDTYREARCDLVSDGTVTGTIYLNQNASRSLIITGSVEGLPKGKHGFHVHEFGVIGYNCTAAGGHFNPYSMPHGGPNFSNRHVGDLGNIESYIDYSTVFVHIEDSVASLFGDYAILGRAIVVHAKEDDFVTQPTGNAGGRLACCNIFAT